MNFDCQFNDNKIDLCSDLEKVQKEIVQELKRKKKGNERSNNKDWLRSVFKNIN